MKRQHSNEENSHTSPSNVMTSVEQPLSTSIVENTLPSLPNEAYLHIFSFLTPLSLSNVQRTCTNWYDISNNKKIWQAFIQRYFPYLIKIEPEAFQKDPLNLYKDECQKYKDIIYDNQYAFTFKVVLDSLEGDLSKIADYTPKEQTVLRHFAIGNGHYAALDQMSPHNKVQALKYAVENKRYDISCHLLHQVKVDISAKDKALLLLKAAATGQLNTVIQLLQIENNYFAKDILKAIHDAACEGYSDIVTHFLQQESAVIKSDEGDLLAEAFERAAENGHLNVVTCMLQLIGPDVLDTSIIAALRSAVRLDLNMVKYLLQHAKTDIFLENINETFRSAAEIGNLDTVSYLFQELEANIPIKDKIKAFQNAVMFNSLNVINYLLQKVEADISIRDKRQAFQSAAGRGNLDIVSILEQCFNTVLTVKDKGDALKNAAKFGHLNVVEHLLQSSIIGEYYKIQAKAIAVKKGFTDIVEAISNNPTSLEKSQPLRYKK